MNVLLAIDGSEASRKAVRFVGRVFGQRAPEDLAVTLLHVIESLPDYLVSRRVDPKAPDSFQEVADRWEADNKATGERLLNQQKQVLVEAGVPEDRLGTKLVVKESLPEAKKVVAALAIIEEMKQGPYAVVCLGRRGASGVESVFPGSVAEKVLRQAAGRTVWVVD